MKKILVIGGTGAIGRYAVQELLNEGYQVDVLSLDHVISDHPYLKYMVGPGKDIKYMKQLLVKEHYDGIVDFMLYRTVSFTDRFQIFLENTDHYIFLSSYRVYADDKVITENSPRLLDVSDNAEYLATEDYSLYKARCENILNASKYSNWTIVRPSITYSVKRYQLVTWEADVLIPRTLKKQKILLPREAMDVETVMTWAGDSGKMFAKLMFNEKAYRETFTLATAEHHPWSYVAECYSELIGAQFELTDKETYVRIKSPGDTINMPQMWQLDYDRLFHRVIDNSKILSVTGLKQEDFMPLKEGLRRELSAIDLKSVDWNINKEINDKMDRFLACSAGRRISDEVVS